MSYTGFTNRNSDLPRRFSLMVAAMLAVLAFAAAASGATYEVGPGKALTAIGQVPWESINAGDTVNIYYRSDAQGGPYREKWVINRQGTASSPITIHGVPGPGGELPVIDGNGATTRLQLSYVGGERSIVQFGSSYIPGDPRASYVIMENLHFKSTRPEYSFTNDSGVTQSYTDNACPVRFIICDHITMRNCEIEDGCNGIMSSYTTSNLLVEGCWIHNNGTPGNIYVHNIYTEALGITYQYNRLGPLADNAPGNNIKDRSAGTVVRFNWFDGGGRQLDLVDSDFSLLYNDPSYFKTFVYGNVVLEHNDAFQSQVVHYGGDSGDVSRYRQGTLYFYNNTVITERTGITYLFRPQADGEAVDCRNNIVYVTAAQGRNLHVWDGSGTVSISHNWLPTGFTGGAAVTDDGTSVTGAAPGFVNLAGQDLHLAQGSSCINAGTALAADCLPDYAVTRQYVKHQSSEPRPADGTIDIGAFEYGSVAPQPLSITTTSLPDGTIGAAYSATLAATGGTPPYAWSIVSGALPAGFTLNASTGAITGTHSDAGTYNFTAKVTDSAGAAGSKALSF